MLGSAMHKCSWCGKEYPDSQAFCLADGTSLEDPRPGLETEPTWHPGVIDFAEVQGAFSFEEGFSRPVWKVISHAIQQKVTIPDELNAAWSEAARQWVMEIRANLGGDYRVRDSRRFILLTELDA